MSLPRIDPALQPLYDAAQELLTASSHLWAPRLAAALRRCKLRLRDGAGGFTVPLLPTIWIGRELADELPTRRGIAVLLHEAAHQCGAVWPEWKLWFNRWGGRFDWKEIYGPEINSADDIAHQVLAGPNPVEKD
jgi:hypothetical protein